MSGRSYPSLRLHIDDDIGYVAVMCTQQRYVDWRNGKVMLNFNYDRDPSGKLEQTFVRPARAWKFVNDKYGQDYDYEPCDTSYKYDDNQLDILARFGLVTYETMADDENIHFVKKLKVDGVTVYTVVAFIEPEPEEFDDDWDE